MKDSQVLKQKLNRPQKNNKSRKFAKKLPSSDEKRIVVAKESAFKRYESDVRLILIPLTLFLVCATLILVNNKIISVISKNLILPIDSQTQMHPYPFIQTVQMPEVSAKASIIVDADSQVTIFSKNPNVRFSMASTTKIMTALVAMEYYKKDAILTVGPANFQGSRLVIHYGDRFYFEDLLYAMLLPSANDAAETIADNYPGGRDAFVRKMNEKAGEFHLKNTHFSDPTGLDDDGDYTTVVDMAHLASIAIKNKDFVGVTGTKNKLISDVGSRRQYMLDNLNKLLGVDGVYGIKTGTTEAAGEVLVTSTVVNGHTFVIVVMNSHSRFNDTKALLLFISENVKYIAPVQSSSGSSGGLETQ